MSGESAKRLTLGQTVYIAGEPSHHLKLCDRQGIVVGIHYLYGETNIQVTVKDSRGNIRVFSAFWLTANPNWQLVI